jgi:outer membrane usher protein FimD/PapC
VQYQKDFAGTGTSFSLASYRYSSGGYYDFSEANALESRNGLLDNKRSREEISFAGVWRYEQPGDFRLVAGVLAPPEPR